MSGDDTVSMILFLGGVIIIALVITLFTVKRFLPQQSRDDFEKRRGVVDRLAKHVPGFAGRSQTEQVEIAKQVTNHPLVIGYGVTVLGGFLVLSIMWSPLLDFINNGGSRAAFVIAAILLPLLIFPILWTQKILAIKILKQRL
jgi:hypothetical protein